MGLIYTIDSAHSAFGSLLHGHTFRVEVYLEGKLKNGVVAGFDFRVVKEKVEKAVMTLNKRNLNDILKEPTVENIACYLIRNLKSLPIKSIRVWESTDRFAEVFREEALAER